MTFYEKCKYWIISMLIICTFIIGACGIVIVYEIETHPRTPIIVTEREVQHNV